MFINPSPNIDVAMFVFVIHAFFSPGQVITPRSTLFPYTTLFRSLNDSSLHYEPETSSALGFGFRIGFFGIDRKSTRLNSSHVATSYAVSCLKNKMALLTLSVVNMACMMLGKSSMKMKPRYAQLVL